MSRYVDEVLVPGERVVHLGRTSLWSVWHLLLFGLLLLPAFGLGLILWAVAYVRIRSTELAVTTKRLIVKHGFIRRHTMEININKVESIQVEQSLTGRMLNFGTLVIAGTGSSHAPLAGIADPLGFRRAFVEAQDAAPTNQT
ncbi:putative membrane protein YdbT with pleckstrin-like domain [Pelomonas saccharophila]|uniref:Membrane protein YdbT with pleckstrin-like domain n=1 Tax=Roseateles saccharophilus TaxID=304 RepID=A0ABU1YII9_ROSSA|nr:PH domain-containing protein [Roseateles saccharophilus]MDR7268666.1 putative membrane protein YdbT with pleckstrin-like domain [Roseateles saccharophilus]